MTGEAQLRCRTTKKHLSTEHALKTSKLRLRFQVLLSIEELDLLFLCISILEGTGYLARAAFLMDRLLGWCGLNGRAFIPLLSSFA